MTRRVATAASWVLAIASGVTLAEGWQPWATIVGVVTLIGWTALIADFGLRMHRARHQRLTRR
jgi:hypothetical protein